MSPPSPLRPSRLFTRLLTFVYANFITVLLLESDLYSIYIKGDSKLTYIAI